MTTKFDVGDNVVQVITHDNGFTIRAGKITDIHITKDGVEYKVNFAYGIIPVIDIVKERQILTKKELPTVVKTLIDTCID